MPRIAYKHFDFRSATLERIQQANAIIEEYRAQGFELTLRQLYYQFVSRSIIPNSDKEYGKLGDIISDARLAGLVDWYAIVDRTRNLRNNSHWGTPADIIGSAANSFAIDKWATQPYRVEVWVEKDALVGVVGGICARLDVPFFSCRGYTSQSEMWVAAQRLRRFQQNGQTPYLLHLGDHDPSGKDMSRDIQERLDLFGTRLEFDRLALNWDQIEQYNPPPNPAKLTDTRATGYIREFGNESWELDALEPRVIADTIQKAVLELRDEDKWQEAIEKEDEGTKLLNRVTREWDSVVRFLEV